MKIKKIALLLSLITLPALVLANGEHHVTMMDSDFKYRVLNFTIFAGLVYYLVANPIKTFFAGRSEDISNRLLEIEEKLKASKQKGIVAEENLVKARKRAEDILNDAKKESKLLSANIAEKNDKSLSLLDKQLEEKQEVELKKATTKTIANLLNGGFENSDINIDETKVVSLISKKVA